MGINIAMSVFIGMVCLLFYATYKVKQQREKDFEDFKKGLPFNELVAIINNNIEKVSILRAYFDPYKYAYIIKNNYKIL